MLPSLCVVIVRVFCSTFLIVCVPFQFNFYTGRNAQKQSVPLQVLEARSAICVGPYQVRRSLM
jgi:hypothetical protein